MMLTARDMLKLGKLYAQKGMWGKNRIISSAWVNQSTSLQFDNRQEGYGYQWWMAKYGKYDAYQAMGFGGQRIVVIPKLDSVIVVTHRSHTLDNTMQFFIEDLVMALSQASK